MQQIKGIHHVALKPCGKEAFDKTVTFYHAILGLPIVRIWQDSEKYGAMLAAGSSLIEILSNGTGETGHGSIPHFAFAVSDPDMLIQQVQEAGYEVLLAPKHISIPSEPVYPARIAFCRGPLGEEIEFFCETTSYNEI